MVRDRLKGVDTHLTGFTDRSNDQRQEVAQAAAEAQAEREARPGLPIPVRVDSEPLSADEARP